MIDLRDATLLQLAFASRRARPWGTGAKGVARGLHLRLWTLSWGAADASVGEGKELCRSIGKER